MKDNLLKQRIITSTLITIALVATMNPSYQQKPELNLHSMVKNSNILNS